MQKLAESLCAFQKSVGTIEKNAKAQFGEFADLSQVLSVVIPHLSANGLNLSQSFVDDADNHYLVTYLFHISGDTLQSKTRLVIPPTRGNPLHAWGSAVTYQRRYAILSILGLAAGIEDNDGQLPPETTVALKEKNLSQKPAPTQAHEQNQAVSGLTDEAKKQTLQQLESWMKVCQANSNLTLTDELQATFKAKFPRSRWPKPFWPNVIETRDAAELVLNFISQNPGAPTSWNETAVL